MVISRYLQNFVQVICRGIKDPDSVVRNAALYAVGQYSEYLQVCMQLQFYLYFVLYINKGYLESIVSSILL